MVSNQEFIELLLDRYLILVKEFPYARDEQVEEYAEKNGYADMFIDWDEVTLRAQVIDDNGFSSAEVISAWRCTGADIEGGELSEGITAWAGSVKGLSVKDGKLLVGKEEAEEGDIAFIVAYDEMMLYKRG